MQDDDGTVLGSEGSERPLEGIALVNGNGLVGSSRSVDRERSNVGGPPPVATELLVTGVHDEPVQPHLEATRVTQPWQLAPGEEECLLDGVLGPLDVAKDPIRDGVAAVTVQIDQLREGALVAVPRPLDQPLSHDRPFSAAPGWALH